jgi:hypothetical protein
MAPTLENPPSWHKCARPREICPRACSLTSRMTAKGYSGHCPCLALPVFRQRRRCRRVLTTCAVPELCPAHTVQVKEKYVPRSIAGTVWYKCRSAASIAVACPTDRKCIPVGEFRGTANGTCEFFGRLYNTGKDLCCPCSQICGAPLYLSTAILYTVQGMAIQRRRPCAKLR